MKTVITSLTFQIGTLAGQYPAGNKIVSELFKFSRISFILLNNTPNATDFTQDMAAGELDFSVIGPVSNGSKVTVTFENAITITA